MTFAVDDSGDLRYAYDELEQNIPLTSQITTEVFIKAMMN